MHIAVLPLGRSTFDTEFAAEKLAAMFVALEQTGHLISGPRVLMCDQADCSEALAQMQECSPDLVLVLQVTFTDAAFVVEVANATPQPLALWAVPEPRIGGRLRLNAFCGLILASHALGRNHRRFSYLYHDPADRKVGQPLLEFLDGRRRSRVVEGHAAVPAGAVLPESLRNLRIARNLRRIIFAPRWQKAFISTFRRSGTVRMMYMRLLAGEVEYPELARRVLARLPRYLLNALRRTP